MKARRDDWRSRLHLTAVALLVGHVEMACSTSSATGPNADTSSNSDQDAGDDSAGGSWDAPAEDALADSASSPDATGPAEAAADGERDSAEVDAAPGASPDASDGGGCPALVSPPDASAAAAATCSALLTGNSSLPDGVYILDLDGTGSLPPLPFYCDMTNGGWTLVANQVPDTLLPDDECTVNPAGFGSITQSFRLGVPGITSIQPTVAWKLTDAANAVYFKPTCVVDWTINYDTLMPMPTVCTTGYTGTSFSSVENGAWVNASVRGIGINNSGASCSMRMYESHMKTNGTIETSSGPAGPAHPCNYNQNTSQRVSLWFK